MLFRNVLLNFKIFLRFPIFLSVIYFLFSSTWFNSTFYDFYSFKKLKCALCYRMLTISVSITYEHEKNMYFGVFRGNILSMPIKSSWSTVLFNYIVSVFLLDNYSSPGLLRICKTQVVRLWWNSFLGTGLCWLFLTYFKISFPFTLHEAQDDFFLFFILRTGKTPWGETPASVKVPLRLGPQEL